MTTAEHTFSAACRGYDRTQVDAQLDVLSTQLRAATSARQSALAQVEALARKLEAGIGDIQSARAVKHARLPVVATPALIAAGPSPTRSPAGHDEHGTNTQHAHNEQAAYRPGSVTLKCDPSLALELRARHAAVRPGYHANKRHWNTVDLDGSIDPEDVREMIEHSYRLVRGLLPRSRPPGR